MQTHRPRHYGFAGDGCDQRHIAGNPRTEKIVAHLDRPPRLDVHHNIAEITHRVGQPIQGGNLAAVGDLTALDPYLTNDFGEMLELGLVASFEDRRVHTHFRLNGELNVHAEYGYLVNEQTAHTIVAWWRGQKGP